MLGLRSRLTGKPPRPPRPGEPWLQGQPKVRQEWGEGTRSEWGPLSLSHAGDWEGLVTSTDPGVRAWVCADQWRVETRCGPDSVP